MKKRIAIIGCGGIGEYHLEHLVEFNDIELAAFCDVIPERAQDFAKRSGGGNVYDNYLSMLEHETLDAVFLCIPPYAHGEIEFALIELGIHMFVEKPVTLDLESGKRIRDAAEAKGLITAVGFQCRYSGLVDSSKSFFDNNQVVHATCTRIGGIPETPWWPSKELSGGQMVEQTIHNVDIIRYHLGEPDTVFSLAARGFIDGGSGYDTDDLSVAVIKFKSGAIASIMTGCYAESGASADNKITFSAKSARADLRILGSLDVYGMAEEADSGAEEQGGFVIKTDGAIRSGAGAVQNYKESLDAGVACDRTFIDALFTGDGSKIRSTYADGLRSVALTLACNMSIDSGKAIRFDDLLV